MPDAGILTSGIGAHDPDDAALVRAMVRIELAWTEALERHGLVSAAALAATQEAAARLERDGQWALAQILADQEAASGNPVVPLVAALKEAVGAEHRDAVHTGLTSQDVLDTALMLVVNEAADAAHDELTGAARALTDLATEHRDTVALAHTLTQGALPTTFGMRAATWLQALGEARERLAHERAHAVVACGGPAGTLSLPAGLPETTELLPVISTWAQTLGLDVPVAPWHVTRFPVMRIASALAEVCAAAGKVGADVALASRPEVGELREHSDAGKGGSSSMDFKDNPVVAISLNRSAMTAPFALSQVYAAAGQASDERPDGAWHAEWEPLRTLARHGLIAARGVCALVSGITVNDKAMARHVAAHGQPRPADHVAALIDRVIAQYGQSS